MLALTAEIGQTVVSPDGLTVGRVIDLSVDLEREPPRVHRLAVGRRHRVQYLVPWSAVHSFEHAAVSLRPEVVLATFAVDPTHPPPLAPGELLLVRDVLDTQIVDVDHHRVARVADVMLDRPADGRLDVVAVDVGLSGLLRRLGLRGIGERLPEHAIDWDDLHLTSNRGHASQLATTTAAVHRLDSRDLAELLTRLRVEAGADVLNKVGPTRAASAIARTHPAVGRSLLRALEPTQADRLVREMPRGSAAHYRRIVAGEPLPRRRALRTKGWRHNRPPAQPRHSPKTP